MSKISRGKLLIKDLGVLRKVLAGRWPLAELVKASEYKWFGRIFGREGAILPEGFEKDDLGKCEWKIKLKGVNYEVGLAKPKGKDGYALLWDEFTYEEEHDGRKLIEAFGEGMADLSNEYRHGCIEKQGKAMGRQVTKIEDKESLDRWNRAQRMIDMNFEPIKWKGKMMTIVEGPSV